MNIWPAVTDEVVFASEVVSNYVGTVRSAPGGREEVFVELEFHDGTGADARRLAVDAIRAGLHREVGLRVDAREA